jgi:glycosyltransferase involved in cell wall biosynthesis
LHLLVSGVGEVQQAPGVVLRQGVYSEAEVEERLSTVRAVVLPYAEASQSGVQVLAMQFGVPTVVTDVGALPEMQPIGAPIVPYGDEVAMAGALVKLCEGEVQSGLAAAARDVYRVQHSGPVIAHQLIEALESMAP